MRDFLIIVNGKMIKTDSSISRLETSLNTYFGKLALSYDCDVILTDAMALDIDKEVISLIKGDTKSINIAAASILAKVTRDHIMKGYDLMYPEYGYKKHQGYYTKAHKEALTKYGSKDFYRFSFAPSNLYKKDQGK